VKTEILFGIHPVIEALKAARIEFFEVYLVKDKISKRIEVALSLIESSNISIKTISASRLSTIAQTDVHQGLGARVSPYPTPRVTDILNRPGDGNYFFLLLDSVLDPHNLGALVRTALCVGINGVVIPKNRSALPTPVVSKVSSGALEHVFLSRVTNLVDTIKTLKEKGIWVAGLEKDANQSLFVSDLTCSLAIIVGGEEKGLRPLVKKHCDFLISIPQIGKVSSLNASVAGGVVMYEAFRQRSAFKAQ
jgi:23S rRNA (guanosine2251-2'-O)-methyltransferase